MGITQISQGKDILDTAPWRKTKHGKHKNPNYQQDYYLKNRQRLLTLRKARHQENYQKKPSKLRSLFVEKREKKALKCLDKHHITVPVPRHLKIKHPIIKDWNKPNWWWKEKITDLLAKGHNYFTLLNKDGSYKGVRIGCIDIDEKGWTKIPTKYWTCYISASNGKIKLLFLYQDNGGLKTSKGYFQGRKILDFKISGGIMGIGSIHPNGNVYQLKGAGSFFLNNNQIFNNPQEVADLLKKDWQIEIKSISQHFVYQKEQKIFPAIPFIEQRNLIIPTREPPNRWKNLNNLSKLANY